MFRFWFIVDFKDANGDSENDDFPVVQEGDSIFDARAQLVYLLSRNPKVHAPFTIDFQYMEERIAGSWVKI